MPRLYFQISSYSDVLGEQEFWNLGETLLDSIQCPSFFIFTYYFLPHRVFLAAWAFSSFREQEPLFAAVHQFLPAVVSLVAEHRLQCAWASWLGPKGSVAEMPWFQRAGSGAVAHRLSCSAACGFFLDQGSNPYPLHWQVDSLPLSHHGSLRYISLNKWKCYLYGWWYSIIHLKLAKKVDLKHSHHRKENGDYVKWWRC